MGFFVRAVVTGFGLSLGKFLFDTVKDRVLGEEEPRPQRVVVDNVTDFQPPSDDESGDSPA